MEKKNLFFYGFLVAGILILLYLIISSGLPTNLDIFRQVNIYLLFLAFLLTNLNVLVKIYRWKYLSHAYGADIEYAESGKIVLGSFFISGITPAKIGDIIKAYLMKKRHALPVIDGVSSILYERVFELLLLFLVSLGVFYVGLSAKNYIIIQLTSLILIFTLIAYRFSDKILLWAQKFLTRTKLVTMSGEDLRVNKISPVQAFVVFCLTGFALGLEFLRLWIVVLAFGFDMNIIHLSIFFCLAVLIGLLSQIPVGIGVVEGSLALFLTDAGLPSYFAFGIVLVDRVISMYYVMAIGLIYYKWALKSAMEEPQ
jgi:hypothetical protein